MFGRRTSGAEVAEALKALEVRVARVAEEVQSAVARLEGKVARFEAEEVARTAAFENARDRLHRVVERARRAGELRADRGSDDADSDADLDAFYDLYDRQRRAAG
jgi:hypothetical protein